MDIPGICLVYDTYINVNQAYFNHILVIYQVVGDDEEGRAHSGRSSSNNITWSGHCAYFLHVSATASVGSTHMNLAGGLGQEKGRCLYMAFVSVYFWCIPGKYKSYTGYISEYTMSVIYLVYT
jgi:hypothetical protein